MEKLFTEPGIISRDDDRVEVSITVFSSILDMVNERRAVMSSRLGYDLDLSRAMEMLLLIAIDQHRQICSETLARH